MLYHTLQYQLLHTHKRVFPHARASQLKHLILNVKEMKRSADVHFEHLSPRRHVNPPITNSATPLVDSPTPLVNSKWPGTQLANLPRRGRVDQRCSRVVEVNSYPHKSILLTICLNSEGGERDVETFNLKRFVRLKADGNLISCRCILRGSSSATVSRGSWAIDDGHSVIVTLVWIYEISYMFTV